MSAGLKTSLLAALGAALAACAEQSPGAPGAIPPYGAYPGQSTYPPYYGRSGYDDPDFPGAYDPPRRAAPPPPPPPPPPSCPAGQVLSGGKCYKPNQ